MSTVKWKGGFDYKLCTRSAVWEKRVLGNEITAAVHPPFTAVQNVLQHKSPSKAGRAKRAANRASSCLLVSNRDFVNVANLRVRHDTKSHAGIQRKGLCHNYTSASHSFPPPLTSEGRRLWVQLLDGGKTSSAQRIRNGPVWEGCQHNDLRIASSTICVKVKSEKKKGREWIYTEEGAGSGGREMDWGSVRSLGMKKEKTAAVRRIPY